MGAVYGVKKYYTIPEAASVLGMPERKVYYMLRKGEIKGFKRGRNWIIPRREIARCLKSKGEGQ